MTTRHPRGRRGVALLAALWLVVMITTAGLQFATVARERRQVGSTVADLGRDAAALEGALAEVQARLEWEAREAREARAVGGRPIRTARATRAADPWQNLEARFTAPIAIGDRDIAVRALDLGTVVNVNLAGETELASLFERVLVDGDAATRLAQSIADWRDDDDLSRPRGAEVEQYRRSDLPVRPANGPFRTLDELVDVQGMTPARLERLRPYLTADGAVRRVNVNAAPVVVLRTLPGMTEPLLTTIMALRERGRRVESIPALVSAVRGAGRAGTGERDALTRMLTESISLDTRDVALELTVRHPAGAVGTRLTALLHRDDDGTVWVGARRW